MTQITLKNEEAQFSALKKQATDIAEQCNKLTVTDDTSLAVTTQNLSKAQDTIKDIEAKRVLLKKPFYDAGTQIDALAKKLSLPIQTAVAAGKNKILAYNAEVKRKALVESNRILGIKNAIADYSNDAIAEMDNCKTMEELREVRERLVVNHPGAEKWFEFLPNFLETRNTLNEYAKSVKTRILTPAQADEEETIAIAEVIQEANNQIGTEAIAETVVAKLKGSTQRLKWRVSSLEEVPLEWLQVNDKEVEDYKKNNKDTITDGFVFQGIEFYFEESLTIR